MITGGEVSEWVYAESVQADKTRAKSSSSNQFITLFLQTVESISNYMWFHEWSTFAMNEMWKFTYL